MQAVILAEGIGTRLKPLTDATPKPLIPVGGIPILEHTILFLKKHNINEIYISVFYLKEKIIEYFGNGEKWGVSIKYFEPQKLLGTGGAVKQLQKKLNDPFIVMYCDYLMQFNFKKVIQTHSLLPKTTIATIITSQYYQPESCDHFIVNNNKITGIINRPLPKNTQIRNITNRGIYVCNKEIFEFFPEEIQEISFERDVFPKIIESPKYDLYSFMTNEYITDMGTPEGLLKVRNDYAQNKHLNEGETIGTEFFSVS